MVDSPIMRDSPTANLKELLRQAFSTPVRWISGEGAESGALNWVVSSPEAVRPGDILVVDGSMLSREILEAAQAAGASAVIALGEAQPALEDPPDGLPVIAAPGESDLRTVQRNLLTPLVNQRAGLIERGARIHTQLAQLEAEGQGLAGLARAMAEISGRGALIQDKRGRVLAEFPSSALRSIWPDILAQLGTLDSLPEPMLDRKRAGSQASILTQEFPGDLARLLIPITVGGVARGYLSLVGLAGELDTLDRLVAEQGAIVCAVEMARNKAVREVEKRLKGDLLAVLLQEQLSPRDTMVWAQAAGVDLNHAHAALRFAWSAAEPPSRRRLETLVNGEIARRNLPVFVSPIGTEVICFCQVNSRSARPLQALELGRAVLEGSLKEFPDSPAHCGVGLPVAEIGEWRSSFYQAGQALEIARRLKERQPLYFPDLSVYRLLFQFEHNPELAVFQESILGPLLDYEGGAELIRTLEAFFEHHGNLSQTAEALFIHRNTMIYRLERIAEITGLDLDKPETRLAVHLALHVHKMMGSGRD